MPVLNRRQKSYLRGAIWVAALVGLVLLPGFDTGAVDAPPVAESSP